VKTRRTVETTEIRTEFTVVFDDGESNSGQCTVRHSRQLIFDDGEWVRGSHDVDVICDEDLPYGTHGRPGRVTVAAGDTIVGTDNWKVYPSSRRLLSYGGD
jgi:hypothetical protein